MMVQRCGSTLSDSISFSCKPKTVLSVLMLFSSVTTRKKNTKTGCGWGDTRKYSCRITQLTHTDTQGSTQPNQKQIQKSYTQAAGENMEHKKEQN